MVTAEDARKSNLPSSVLVPAIDTDDFGKDGVLGKPSRFAIRTEPNIMPCKEVMDHLERNRSKMAPRGRQGNAWMPPESFHLLDLSQPTLLVPRIAKTPRAIRVPAGHLPINHNISVVCGDQALLDHIERELSTELASTWMREHAAPLENGYLSLTTTLLRKMPIRPMNVSGELLRAPKALNVE